MRLGNPRRIRTPKERVQELEPRARLGMFFDGERAWYDLRIDHEPFTGKYESPKQAWAAGLENLRAKVRQEGW